MVEYFPILAVFLFGAIIGSFLNVVILRLHTGRGLDGRSHCLTCGARLGFFELIPVLSYLGLLGKCKSCGAAFSPRYAMVEALTGFAFVCIYQSAADPFSLVLELIIAVLLIVILTYDLDHLIIPNELVLFLSLPALILFLWQKDALTFASVAIDFLAPLFAGGFFYALWKISGGRWIGLGDAKLSLPLALIVGLSGVFSLVVLSFWVGAVVSVLLLGLQRLVKARGQKRLRFLGTPLTMRSEVPFAPFLITSFVLVYYFHASAFGVTNALIAHVF